MSGDGVTIPVDGASLHCVVLGRGPALLVLTGVGTTFYESLTPRELAERFQIVYVDPRGSGKSTGDPTQLTWPRLCEDLERVRTHLGIDRLSVLGHSILGVLAIEYGRLCPSSVSHVVAVGTPPRGNMAWVAERSRGFFEECASEDRKRALEASMAGLPQGASGRQALSAQTPMRFFDPRFDAAPLYEVISSSPKFLAHVMGNLAAAWDITEDPGSLRVPVFVALGRHDYVVPHVLWDGPAARVPAATVQVFERSGHQPFFEEPVAFVAALTEWMESHP